MKELKVALCGCTGHVDKFAGIVNSVQGSCVTAVWDYNQERGKKTAESLDLPFEESYDRLLSDYDLDAVIIVAEAVWHKELVLKAAKAGKHIFLEKPLCVDPQDAREMQAAVKEAGITFYMSDPFVRSGTLAAKELIENGTLGTITGARIRKADNTALSEDCWINYDKSLTLGGIMADMGGHMLHVLLFLFGKPSALYASVVCQTEKGKANDFDENAVVLMNYPDGKLVTVESSWVSGVESNSQEVYGTLGCLSISQIGPEEGDDLVVCRLNDGREIRISKEGLPQNPTQHVRYWLQMIQEQLPNDIVGKAPLSNSGLSIDNAVMIVDMIDAIYESVRTGRKITL